MKKTINDFSSLKLVTPQQQLNFFNKYKKIEQKVKSFEYENTRHKNYKTYDYYCEQLRIMRMTLNLLGINFEEINKN